MNTNFVILSDFVAKISYSLLKHLTFQPKLPFFRWSHWDLGGTQWDLGGTKVGASWDYSWSAVGLAWEECGRSMGASTEELGTGHFPSICHWIMSDRNHKNQNKQLSQRRKGLMVNKEMIFNFVILWLCD